MAEKRYAFVCMNVDCLTRGANKVMDRLQARVSGNGGANADVRPYMCFGGCHDGPNVVIYPDKVWYAGVKEGDADAIVDQHFNRGEPVTRLTGKVEKDLEELIYQLLDAGLF